jgi:hypothetical protein
MAVTVGVDSYVDESQLDAYAAARDITLDGNKSASLIKSMDYLALQSWAGEKTDPGQPLDFPRDGDTVVPAAIEKAQMQLALMVFQGIDLLAPRGPAVKREKVDVLEVEYQDGAGSVTVYPAVDKLIAPYLARSTGYANFAVVRS